MNQLYQANVMALKRRLSQKELQVGKNNFNRLILNMNRKG